MHVLMGNAAVHNLFQVGENQVIEQYVYYNPISIFKNPIW